MSKKTIECDWHKTSVSAAWAGLDRADKNVKKDWHCTSISALFGFTFWTQVKLQTIQNS